MNNKRNKLHLHCLMLVMLVIVMTFFVSGFDMTRRVIVEVDGQTKVLRTNTSNPKKILAEAGIILENGDVINLTKDRVYKEGHVPADDIYVDGSRIGDVGNMVIKDRKLMSSNGILVIIANIDPNALPEIEENISSVMMEEKKKYIQRESENI